MERRFEVRLERLMDDAVLDPEVFRGMLGRLECFVDLFAARLKRCEQRQHAWEYIAGLLSDVERKNAESIAYHHDQDRQPLQKFVGQVPWDYRPLLAELTQQVGAELGEADGVMVFDPSAFTKKGNNSVGVDRQWCGRWGKVDNCQVGIYMAYASRKEHALVDVRLYLSKDWAKDKKRRKKCGVPKEVRFRTRHQLALEMLAEHGAMLPHAWIAGDDEMGRSSAFRRDLRALEEQYLLDVPANTLVRDLDAPPPPYGGRGRCPKAPFTRVDRWCEALPRMPGRRSRCAMAKRARWWWKESRCGCWRKPSAAQRSEEVLVIFRERQEDGTIKHDYSFPTARRYPLDEFARVAKAEHRIEECLQRAKSEAGLADYQVRTWIGWHHHQTLSLIAAWFLTQETRRGEKIHPRYYRASRSFDHRLVAA